MGWTSPSGHVYATDEELSATTLNTYVKDNLIDLDRRTSPSTAGVATSQTSTSSSPADLATSGPAVTVTIGVNGMAYVTVSCAQSNGTATKDTFMGFAISGATTLGATAEFSQGFTSPTDGGGIRTSTTFLITGLTAGSNTFTAKYWVGTTGTGTWLDRKITVVALGS